MSVVLWFQGETLTFCVCIYILIFINIYISIPVISVQHLVCIFFCFYFLLVRDPVLYMLLMLDHCDCVRVARLCGSCWLSHCDCANSLSVNKLHRMTTLILGIQVALHILAKLFAAVFVCFVFACVSPQTLFNSLSVSHHNVFLKSFSL